MAPLKEHYQTSLLIIALGLSITLFNWLNGEHFILSQVANSGHGVVFFLGTLLLLKTVKVTDSFNFNLLTICLLSCLLGLGIEVIQPYVGRNASLLDFIYDVIGILAAALLYSAAKSRKQSTRENAQKSHPRTLYFLSTLCLLSLFVYPTYRWFVLIQHHAQLPFLYSFDTESEAAFWSLNGDSKLELKPAPGHHNQMALITLSTEKYPGISFKHFYHDWSDYNSLSFQLYTESNMKLIVRIHDSAHNNTYTDRFNKSLELKNGMNQVVIPLEEIANAPTHRTLDLANIENITLFAISPEQPVQFYLDEIKLIH